MSSAIANVWVQVVYIPNGKTIPQYWDSYLNLIPRMAKSQISK